MDDQTAIARLKQGDIDGLEALVRHHQTQALRTAYLVCMQRDMAQDVVQDAFILAYEHIAQFDSQRAFAPWFMHIVTNRALMAIRRQQSMPLDDQAAEVALSDQSPSPEQLFERAETRQEVWAVLSRLSPQQRSAIVLRYYVGLDQTEMSAVLGAPTGTIKRRLHDARERLHGLITRWAHDCRGHAPTPVEQRELR